MSKYIKPPIVYQGNKFRHIKKLVKFLPKDIDERIFLDPFGGSSTMSLNFGKEAHYNELNFFIYSLVKNIYENKDKMLEYHNRWVKEFDLIKDLHIKENIEPFKQNYNKFRKYANSLERNSLEHTCAIFTCHVFAINGLIRFNKSGGYNASAGFDFRNNHHTKKLEKFLKRDNIYFHNKDYRNFIDDFLKEQWKHDEEYYIYLDPPYLNTTAVYNEKRLTSWNEQSEIELMAYLDRLNGFGIKWGMSNSLIGKHGEVNMRLAEWSEKYIVHFLDVNYASFGKSNTKNIEVFITNI